MGAQLTDVAVAAQIKSADMVRFTWQNILQTIELTRAKDGRYAAGVCRSWYAGTRQPLHRTASEVCKKRDWRWYTTAQEAMSKFTIEKVLSYLLDIYIAMETEG